TVPDVAATDIVGHEYTHLVTAHNSGLIYERQSGALNEALSDIFGEMIEQHADPHGTGQFVFGEDTGPAILDLRHPHKTWSAYVKNAVFPDNMGEAMPTMDKLTEANDWGWVHHNSTIPCNAWALMAEGGTHDTTYVKVPALGWDPTVNFWWKTQRHWMAKR